MAGALRTIASSDDLKLALSSCSKVSGQQSICVEASGSPTAAIADGHTYEVADGRTCSVQAVLFFWASWSAPCKHMQQVLETLAKQHQGIAYLQVRMQLQGPCAGAQP
jgi:thiol-disulfide isomerase/thioredoxin